MKRSNILIIYLIIVSVIMIFALVLMAVLPFAMGIFKDNSGAVILFIGVCATLAGIALAMTVYYMFSLITSIEIKDDSLIIAVFFKIHNFRFGEIDIKDLTGGKYKIVSKSKIKFTLYIKLLDDCSLKALYEAIARI